MRSSRSPFLLEVPRVPGWSKLLLWSLCLQRAQSSLQQGIFSDNFLHERYSQACHLRPFRQYVCLCTTNPGVGICLVPDVDVIFDVLLERR